MKAIVLGSGFTQFSNYFDIHFSMSYPEITGAVIPELEGHERAMHLANYRGEEFIILSGKLHFYEGFTMEEIVAPINYVIEKYGVDSLVITSASGGLSPDIAIGTWYNITAILNFPDPAKPIMGGLSRSKCSHFMQLDNVAYAYHQGPSLGTMAEYKALNKIGANVVGMSMAPEINTLRSKDIEILPLTLPVCNYFPFTCATEPSHEEVVEIASQSIVPLVELFCNLLKNTSTNE